jgi:hypothetical protein
LDASQSLRFDDTCSSEEASPESHHVSALARMQHFFFSFYRRVVHPDKVSTESVEVQALAQQIFAVLTEAMANLK